jgi:ATP phosphoribosyltransferase regulatory subunit
MTEDLPPNPALLPSGFRDVLPPEAEAEALAVETLMGVFAAHGYQRVKPPLLEFEEGFLSGAGGALAEYTFRLMDPQSHRMMALRSDTTPQVARIAATRLADAPRPLRLSYAGQCLRVRASGLSADRQIAQAGIELIGADSPAADAELVLIAAEALAALGLQAVSFDLTLPPFIPALLAESGIEENGRAELAHALDRKDAAAVREFGGALAPVLIALLHAAGPAPRALEALRAAPLPEGARGQAERLAATVALIESEAARRGLGSLRLTIDPVEFRGYRYHTGLSLTVYGLATAEELGRGGRYVGPSGEPAAGVTLYPDAIMRAAPRRPPRPRVYLAASADPGTARALRLQGYATLAALGEEEEVAAARRLGCGFVLRGSELIPLEAD